MPVTGLLYLYITLQFFVFYTEGTSSKKKKTGLKYLFKIKR